MKILAIDTSTKFLCLGLYDAGRIYEYNLETGRNLSCLISVTTQRVMEAVGWRPEDIDYLACGLGPGSFTGIRVGLSAIKGMSWALEKPLIGIPSLDILAQGVRNSDRPIIPVIDAKRGLVYCAVYRRVKDALKRTTPYMLISIEEFLRKGKSRAIVFGDALALYQDKIVENIKGVVILDRDYWYPKPHNIIKLALEKIKEKKISNPFTIKPIYLYPKECQVKR